MAPPETQFPHIMNQAAPDTSSNSCANIYLSGSDDAPVLEEMVGGEVNKPINTISTYNVSPLVVSLNSIPYKVLNNSFKKIRQR